MSGYTAAWVAWIAGTVGAFTYLECRAIRDGRAGKPGGTLSEHIRVWIGLHRGGNARVIGGALFAGAVCGFAAWFVPHIFGA